MMVYLLSYLPNVLEILLLTSNSGVNGHGSPNYSNINYGGQLRLEIGPITRGVQPHSGGRIGNTVSPVGHEYRSGANSAVGGGNF